MDWGSALADAGTIAAVATGIAFGIQFLKTVYYKLPWGWIQKTPGEVWFALSIIAGLGVAIFVSWDSIKDVITGDSTFTSKSVEVIMGLASGAGSKVIHAVTSPAGAALKAFKLEKAAKADALTGGTGYIAPGTGAAALANGNGKTVQTPIFTEAATPTLEQRIGETKQRIDGIIMVPKKTDIPLVELVKKMKTDADYAIINGTVYEISKKQMKEGE